MRKTFRRAVVLGLLAFAAPFAALPLAKPAAAMPEASAPVLPDAVDTPAATPQPVLPAVPESRSFDADAPILTSAEELAELCFPLSTARQQGFRRWFRRPCLR